MLDTGNDITLVIRMFCWSSSCRRVVWGHVHQSSCCDMTHCKSLAWLLSFSTFVQYICCSVCLLFKGVATSVITVSRNVGPGNISVSVLCDCFGDNASSWLRVTFAVQYASFANFTLSRSQRLLFVSSLMIHALCIQRHFSISDVKDINIGHCWCSKFFPFWLNHHLLWYCSLDFCRSVHSLSTCVVLSVCCSKV